MTSTSTTHSGRASPVTTTPVKTGMHAFEPPPQHLVDRLSVADVGEVDGGLADVLEPRSALVEELRDVRHRTIGLAGGVADRDRLARVEILPDLPPQVHRVPGDDRLGEVVRDPLLGIGVAGVEGADAAMAHAGTRSESPAACRTTSSGPAKSKLR